MTGISSKAFGGVENKKKYNGIEFNNDLDINEYDAFYRTLDPQIGKFLQIDPKIESAEAWAPYSAMLDNPIRYMDPLGDSTIPGGGFWGNVWQGLKDGAKETGSFVKSLGTKEGWKNLGNGLADMADRANPTSVTGMAKNAMTGMNVYEGVKNIPNMTKDDLGHAIGYSTEKVAEAVVVTKGAGIVKNVGMELGVVEAKGLKTPAKFFGNLTESQAKTVLEKKYGSATYSIPDKTSFFNPTTKRSFTIHNEPGHGVPHVDINTRSWPNPLNHQKFPLKQ